MSRFDNKLCPICRQPFCENDDIVVCPDCGTPHHRSCWEKANACALTEYHPQGFVWNGRLPDEPEPEPAEIAAAEVNDTVDFSGAQSDEPVTGNENIPDFDIQPDTSFESFMEQIQRVTEDETRGDDGVSNKELCAYTGKSLMHYSRAFTVFRKGISANGVKRQTKIFMNLCSGLFSPVHQFYRKMYGLGIFTMLVSVITAVPSLMVLMGYEGLINIEAYADTLLTLNSVCSIINFAMTVVLCLFGDYFYYRNAVSQIKKIRVAFEDGKKEGYYEALSANGGGSWLRAIIGLLLTAVVAAGLTVLPGVLFTK